MKVLFFGDTFGKPGRDAVRAFIAEARTSLAPDAIIVNCENFAHGRGVLPEQVEEFLGLGVDVLTTGNHVWDQKTLLSYIGGQPRLLRPINFPEHTRISVPGRGMIVLPASGARRAPLGVVQIMGRVHMEAVDCPFRAADAAIERFKSEGVKSIIVDFHAEATSEKQAIAHFLDGRVSAVVGTHSHVQTADARILKNGTAAITDVGLCGVFDSVIGVRKEASIARFLSRVPSPFEPADGQGGVSAALITIDEATGKATAIERIYKEKV